MSVIFKQFRLLLIIELKYLQWAARFLIWIYEIYSNTVLESSDEKKKAYASDLLIHLFSAEKNGGFSKTQFLLKC